MLYLTTLGTFRCSTPEGEIASFQSQRLRAALLVYLAIERVATRDLVMAMLWPERDPAKARHALSQNLYELRRTVGEGPIESDGDRLAVSTAVDTDVGRFATLMSDGRVEEALGLYHGPFLDGQHLCGTHAFESWVARHRVRLSRSHVKARLARVVELESDGNIEAAIHAARRGVEIEPAEDELQHRLIELLLVHGERTQANAQFEAYRRLLEADGLEPLDETKALMERARETGSFMRPPSPTPKPSSTPAPVTADPAPSRLGNERRRGRDRRRWAAGAIAALALAMASLFARALLTGDTLDLDPLTIAILPLQSEAADAENPVDGRLAAFLLSESLARWTDLRVVDPLRVNDGLQRLQLPADGPIPLHSALELARELEAGRVIVGTTWMINDSVRIRASVYSTDGGEAPLATAAARVPADLRSVEALDSLADYLVAGEFRSPAGDAGKRTKSLAAYQSFRTAEAALASWDLETAARGFRDAVRHDPGFASAYLRLAETLEWQLDTMEVWRTAASRAAALAHTLSFQDSLLARGLTALASRDYASACATFRTAVESDSLDFAAWYGLGDCHAWDDAVLPDSGSSSGWSFRSSLNAAVNAYYRAVVIVPSFNFAVEAPGSARLAAMLFVNPRSTRAGRLLGSDSVRFLALPALSHDTLAFVPYRVEDAAARRPGTRPVTHAAAIERNRELLLNVVSRWASSFPNSPDALERLSNALESLGRVRAGRGTAGSALEANERARALATDADQRLRVGVARVRLLLKSREFRNARSLADSLLAAHPDPAARAAGLLAGLASLLGRVHLSAELLARSPAEIPGITRASVPVSALETSQRLLAYAAAGAPADSIAELRRRALRLIDAVVRENGRERARIDLLDRGLALAFFTIGPSEPHEALTSGWPVLVGMQSALARGDAARLRAALAADDSVESRYPPGYQAIDFIYQKALLRLAVGDTAQAIQQLDRLLDNLEMATTGAVEVPEASALVRSMRLRAALASGAAPDPYDWGAAAALLWRDADAELIAEPVTDPSWE